MAYDTEEEALNAIPPSESTNLFGQPLFGGPPSPNPNAPAVGDVHPPEYYYPRANQGPGAPTAHLSDDGTVYSYTGSADEVNNKFSFSDFDRVHANDKTVSPDGHTTTYKFGGRTVTFQTGADGRVTYTDTDQKASIAQRYPMSIPSDANIPKGPLNRDRIKAELQANPDLMYKLAWMVKGETGGITAGNHSKQLIQLESALNRALIRGIPLSQALLSVGESGKGYYATATYADRARPNEKELQEFRDHLLAPALAGSNESGDRLGFIVTGNASGSVAVNDVARGDAKGGYGTITGETYVFHSADLALLRDHPERLAPQGPALASAPNYPEIKKTGVPDHTNVAAITQSKPKVTAAPTMV